MSIIGFANSQSFPLSGKQNKTKPTSKLINSTSENVHHFRWNRSKSPFNRHPISDTLMIIEWYSKEFYSSKNYATTTIRHQCGNFCVVLFREVLALPVIRSDWSINLRSVGQLTLTSELHTPRNPWETPSTSPESCLKPVTSAAAVEESVDNSTSPE